LLSACGKVSRFLLSIRKSETALQNFVAKLSSIQLRLI
jgi:hypothetical protein